jgi:hypothetical protein
MNLDSIKVLFRAPDTMGLYGIPYRMREGQQPGDLWRAHIVHSDVYIDGNMPRVGLADWLWLGSPGWWGSMKKADQKQVAAWLQELGPLVPGGPYEWVDLMKEKEVADGL